jgi:hypothetical protein
MTQDEICNFFRANDAVHIQVAADGDGSPQMAWGDTFIFTRKGTAQGSAGRRVVESPKANASRSVVSL